MIMCCRGCVAPKRYPGCHGSCPEYIAEKSEHERLKDAYEKRGRIGGAIAFERSKKVYKALRGRKK